MRTQLMHVSFDLLLKNNDELANEGEKQKNIRIRCQRRRRNGMCTLVSHSNFTDKGLIWFKILSI